MIRRLFTIASAISLALSVGVDRVAQTEPSEPAPAAIFRRIGTLAVAEHYGGAKFSGDSHALIQITQIGAEHGDDAVKVWKLQSLQPITALMRDRNILNYGLSGDAKTAFTANARTIHIWDVAKSRVRLAIDAPAGDLTSVEMSQDATQLATISTDDESTVVLWHIGDPQPRLRLTHHAKPYWMRFDPTGRWIATLDDYVHIYSTHSGRGIVPPIDWIGFYMTLDGAGFDCTGNRLLVPREQGFVVVPTDGSKQIELKRHIDNFSDQPTDTTHIRFSADGRKVVATNKMWKASAAEIYDAVTGKLERTIGSQMLDCWIGPGNRWMICFPDLIDLKTGHVLQTFPDEVMTAIAPDCSALIVGKEVWQLTESKSTTR